jgi:hypothetical protein
MVCDAPFGSDEIRAPLRDGIALEMDGEDVTDKIDDKYSMCLWVAHPMTPGKHTLGLKCVRALSVYPPCAAHNLQCSMHAPMSVRSSFVLSMVRGWVRARSRCMQGDEQAHDIRRPHRLVVMDRYRLPERTAHATT